MKITKKNLKEWANVVAEGNVCFHSGMSYEQKMYDMGEILKYAIGLLTRDQIERIKGKFQE